MGRRNHGYAEFFAKLSQEIDDRSPASLIEVGGGLVGEDQRRRADEGASDGCALLLTARHPRRAVVEPVPQPDEFEQIDCSLPDRLPIEWFEGQRLCCCLSCCCSGLHANAALRRLRAPN